MERLRTNCPSLNFFTTEQLVSLSKELAKLNNDKKSSLDSQALMMLRLVAPKANDKTLIKFVVDHLKAFTHDAFNEASSDDMEVEIEEQDDADDLPGTVFENYLHNHFVLNGAFLTSWTGRNKIPYPTGTILSRMASEGTKFLPRTPKAQGEDI